MAENLKQLNLRVPEDIKDRFDQMVKEAGMTQVECFAQMMAQAETDELKNMVPEIATEIDAVRTHLDSVMEAYSMAVKRSTEAYDIAANRVRGQLEALGTLTSENKRLTDENKQLAVDVKAAKEEAARLEQELAKAQTKAAEAEELKRQLTEAREQLLTLREQHADALEKAKAESDQQLTEAREQVLKLREQHANEMEKARAEGFAQIMEYMRAQQGK